MKQNGSGFIIFSSLIPKFKILSVIIYFSIFILFPNGNHSDMKKNIRIKIS